MIPLHTTVSAGQAKTPDIRATLAQEPPIESPAITAGFNAQRPKCNENCAIARGSRAEGGSRKAVFPKKWTELSSFRLSDGSLAFCDPEDLDRIRKHHWRVRRIQGKYAVRATFFGRTVTLHRFVLPVDGHIRFRDGNSLNVSKANLVVVPIRNPQSAIHNLQP
jgi:hypothetical protein